MCLRKFKHKKHNCAVCWDNLKYSACLWGGKYVFVSTREQARRSKDGRKVLPSRHFNKYNLYSLRCARKFVWLYCISQLNFDVEIAVPSWWEIQLPWCGGLPVRHGAKRDWTHSTTAVLGTRWEFQGRWLSTERRSSPRDGGASLPVEQWQHRAFSCPLGPHGDWRHWLSQKIEGDY